MFKMIRIDMELVIEEEGQTTQSDFKVTTFFRKITFFFFGILISFLLAEHLNLQNKREWDNIQRKKIARFVY